jgi:hypothetical protein
MTQCYSKEMGINAWIGIECTCVKPSIRQLWFPELQYHAAPYCRVEHLGPMRKMGAGVSSVVMP